MKIVWALVLLMTATVDVAAAKSCAAMTQDLARLRQEYHQYVNGKSKDSAEITFDGLVTILDKIVDLKNEMRKLNKCPIPPRFKSVPERR
jgi:hypothetical protein